MPLDECWIHKLKHIWERSSTKTLNSELEASQATQKRQHCKTKRGIFDSAP